MYSSMLLRRDPPATTEASDVLALLVERYPRNSRFRLRHIEILMERGANAEALVAAEAYLEADCCDWTIGDRALARVWVARAALATSAVDVAARALADIRKNGYDELPYWGKAWHGITTGRTHLLRGRHAQAQAAFTSVITLAKDGYLHDELTAVAEDALTPMVARK